MPTFWQAGAVNRITRRHLLLCSDSRATCHIFGDFFLASRLSLARAMVPCWQPVVSVGFRAFSRLRLLTCRSLIPSSSAASRCVISFFFAFCNVTSRSRSASVISSCPSCIPPIWGLSIGHFYFAQIGHFHFAVTGCLAVGKRDHGTLYKANRRP